MTHSRVFLTNFEVFGNAVKDCLDRSSKSKLKLKRKRRNKMVRFYARETSDTCIQTPPQSLFPLLNLAELLMSLRSTVPDKNSDSLLCLSKFTPTKHELDSIYENDSFAEPSRFYKYCTPLKEQQLLYFMPFVVSSRVLTRIRFNLALIKSLILCRKYFRC